VLLSQLADGLEGGRPRIDPGALLTVDISAQVLAPVAQAELVEALPAGWTIVDAAGGSWDDGLRRLSWRAGALDTKSEFQRRIVVRAPDVSPTDAGPAFEARFSAWLESRDGVAAAPDLTVLVAPRIIVEHFVTAMVDRNTGAVVGGYLATDEAPPPLEIPAKFRLRFQVRNADSLPVDWIPLVQFRLVGATEWTNVPAREYHNGVAFYVAPEVVRGQADKRLPDVPAGPEEPPIAPSALEVSDRDWSDQVPSTGSRSMGPNPAAPMTIPGSAYSEIEFTLASTIGAEYSQAYEFRVTDAGTPLDHASTATVEIGPSPPLVLSPGQRAGIPADGTTAAVQTGLADAISTAPDTVGGPSGGSPDVASTQLATGEPVYALTNARGSGYALLASVVVPTPSGPVAPAAAAVGTHGPFGTTPDQCAVCHRSHAGQARSLLGVAAPQSGLCFTCHDEFGTGANTMVKLQYTDAAVPANGTDSYYRHNALVAGNHTQASLNEFGGVSNRHDECGDCHEPHAATSTASTPTASGWTAAGQQAKTSGVLVVNGAAGTAPAYTFINGQTSQVTREYQLCFKCHSGFTTLLANPTGTPTPYSKYRLDKGIELNPSNASYHPIEAPGTNTTTAMTNQLAATSPFKQWTFTATSTIRCVNCHGDYRKFNATTPPAAGSDLAPHTSRYRGILTQNYRDRALMQSTDAYVASNFALCYLCHGEAPFADGSKNSRTDTNFPLHGYHLRSIGRSSSTSYDIDAPGAGRGYAVCAECHFRIHSTINRVGAQPAYPRLVNFSPNITVGATPWNQAGRSCTLTCHGQSHSAWNY
jgi:predicted CXXCH cytochrome family protein